MIFENGIEPKSNIKIGKKASIVKAKPAVYPKTPKAWCDYYGLDVKGGFVGLYKAVSQDRADFKTGKIKYEGEVIAPDWDSKYEDECGKGLHLCPKPFFCDYFVPGDQKPIYLLCEVALKDIKVYKNGTPEYPWKVRCKKVKVIKEVKK